MEESISFTLNGERVTARHVRSTLSLLELLREEFGLSGARPGCMSGDCGCCNVHVDGKVVPGCLVLAATVDGREVRTVEGLSPSVDELSPLQRSFHEHLAAQCGYCTSGQLMTAQALLDQNPRPTRDEIKRWMAGSICRCTGYYKIIEAIESTAAAQRSGDDVPVADAG